MNNSLAFDGVIPYEEKMNNSDDLLVELSNFFRVIVDSFDEIFKKYGISRSKFNVLLILGKEKEEGLSLSQIGERMKVSKANITKLIDRMEKENLVERKYDKRDRRIVRAELTLKGKELFRVIFPEYKEQWQRIISALENEEKDYLIMILKKIEKRIFENG
ncbi:MAG: MarR family winged helix-turn-helix transcriptional regulator [Thermovenabulum sp.]|uniref:MarR family winged helix-turn-helix transcriptional regulator n=1 Tax=Thermovenabulum sp. TaxID=3100335 RepID=UPI003C7B90ED